jgi:hypothetical protein
MKLDVFLFFLLIAGLLISCAPDQTDGPIVAGLPDRVMLTIPGDPLTSRAVTWRSQSTSQVGIAELVVADADPKHVEGARNLEATSAPWEEGSDDAMGHRVVFDGLSPDTRYSYRVGDGENWSEWFEFSTSSETDHEFSFIYFGDLQNDIRSLGSRVVRQAYRHSPQADFMLFAGDLVNRSREQDWREFFYAGGWIFGLTPTLASPGNHEYDKNETGVRIFSKHWRQIFTFPGNGPRGLEQRAYYLDYQGARLISLDSMLIASDETSRSQQIKWLEGVLAENPKKWTIVVMHHPVHSCSYGRDNPELREGLKPVLERFEVDLVLQGHDHSYCRGNTASVETNEGAVPVYVVSVAGPKMYGLNVMGWQDREASRTQLYQVVRVREAEIAVDTYSVVGELYDSFKIVDSGSGKRFEENPAVLEIPVRNEMPEGFLERYTSEEIERYRELYSE